MGRACSTHGAKRNAYRILLGKRRRPLSRCEDNIKINLREAGWGGME
jgi:hypothetical protein